MELVYVYVGEYEILKNKEISLTSKYRVHKKRNKIEISSSSLPHDFFTKRKTDVTGFFGINGSGKSTAQELIRNIVTNNEDLLPSDYVVIFKTDDSFIYSQGLGRKYSVSHNGNKINSTSLENISESKLSLVHYASIKPVSSLNQYLHSQMDTEHCISAGTLFDSIDSIWLEGEHSQTEKAFDFIEDIGFDSIKSKHAPMLCTIDLKFHHTQLIKKIQNNFLVSLTNEQYNEISPNDSLKKLDKIFCLSNPLEIRALLEEKNTSSIISNPDNRINLDDSRVSIKFKVSIRSDFIKKLKKLTETMPFLDKFYFEIISKILYKKITKKSFDEILDAIILLQNITEGYADEMSHEAAMLLYTIDNAEDKFKLSNFFYNVDHGKFRKYKNRIVIEIRNFKSFLELSRSLQAIREWLPPVDFSWNKISSGQYSQLNMLSQIYRAWKKIEKNSSTKDMRNVVVMIDEGEICLHPELQRSWLVDTLRRLERMIPDKYNIQLIISSHSPLILSELPAGSINFMYKTPPKKTQPSGYFGADIYTLYGSGFLLENTLSELAFKKISKAFRELNNVNEKLPYSYDCYLDFANLVSDKIVKKLLINTINTRFGVNEEKK